MHFDEATGARITANRLEGAGYTFEPEHFHGPLLSMLSSPILRWQGETSWNGLTKGNLRLGVALLSLLTVAGAIGIGRVGGRSSALAAAAFTATSPLLVYYGRMYIHEPVFTAFGMLTLLALLSFLQHPKPLMAAILGIGIGLMAATRETFVISIAAWGLAALFWLWKTEPYTPWRKRATHIWKSHARYLGITLAVTLALIITLYSDFFRDPMGAVKFAKTYFAYRLMPGHTKPFIYYANLLLWPKVQGGLLWTEAGVALLALYGYFQCRRGTMRTACRFIIHSGALHLLIFSLLAYKTPWLASLGWLHICIAAGLGAGQLIRISWGWWRIPAVAIILAILLWQGTQTKRAIFRFAVDPRNPYAYAPTTRDAERMATWLDQLAEDFPILNSKPVTVMGAAYWPLPWYLRRFEQVGYWQTLPADAHTHPLILLVGSGDAIDYTPLEDSHEFFPRGLRPEVLVTIAIRKDIWKDISAGDAP